MKRILLSIIAVVLTTAAAVTSTPAGAQQVTTPQRALPAAWSRPPGSM